MASAKKATADAFPSAPPPADPEAALATDAQEVAAPPPPPAVSVARAKAPKAPKQRFIVAHGSVIGDGHVRFGKGEEYEPTDDDERDRMIAQGSLKAI